MIIKKNLTRLKVIRKFKLDITGNFIFKRKFSIIRLFLISLLKKKKIKSKFDFWRIGFIERPLYARRKTKFYRFFIKRQQFRLFYSFIKIRVLKGIIKKALKRKNSVSLFVYYLESRLDVIIFRLGLVSSIKMARKLIFYGYIFVNSKVVKNYAYNLNENDILNFDIRIFFFLKKHFFNNIFKNKLILCNLPNYIEYCLDNLFFKFTRISLSDIHFIFKMNINTFYSLMIFYKRCLF